MHQTVQCTLTTTTRAIDPCKAVERTLGEPIEILWVVKKYTSSKIATGILAKSMFFLLKVTGAT